MNPITALKDKYITYRLTKADLKKIDEIRLTHGAGHWEQEANNQMCVMQAINMVTTGRRTGSYSHSNFSDDPICVSEAITYFLITMNDYDGAGIEHDDDGKCFVPKRRQNAIKRLAVESINTCPITKKKVNQHGFQEVRDFKNEDYTEAELQRGRILEDVDPGDLKSASRAVRKAIKIYQVAAPVEQV